jgi:putative SOS response-associated peptidase YedK
MCNEFEQQVAWDAYCSMMQDLAWRVPDDQNELDLPQAASIRISDLGSAIVGEGDAARLVRMRFSFDVPKRGPMFNIRSDNPQLGGMTRALVPASAFFEFSGDKPPKSKHRVTLNGAAFMAIAAAWRPAKGNLPASFAMVTVDPGLDMAPYHARQVVVLPPSEWKRWIAQGTHDLLRSLPGGSLTVQTIRKGSGHNADNDTPPPAQGALL